MRIIWPSIFWAWRRLRSWVGTQLILIDQDYIREFVHVRPVHLCNTPHVHCRNCHFFSTTLSSSRSSYLPLRLLITSQFTEMWRRFCYIQGWLTLWSRETKMLNTDALISYLPYYLRMPYAYRYTLPQLTVPHSDLHTHSYSHESHPGHPIFQVAPTPSLIL